MSGSIILDKTTWPRRQHFEFYRRFANPSFNLCVPIAAQTLYECAKDRQVSFFQLALYAMLRSANAEPQLRQRIKDDEVVEYQNIAVMTPILTQDEGFRQVWCDNAATFTDFSTAATPDIEMAKSGTPAPLIVPEQNFFCASCIPWLHFSEMTHAEFHFGASVPTMTWGKLKNGVIPVAGKFNHALVDGLHASRFFAGLETLFAHPDTLWLPLN